MADVKTQPAGSAPAGAPDEAGPVRLVLTLGIAGFFAGLLLVSGYVYSLPRIEAHKAEALEQAIRRVLPGTVRTERLEWNDPALAEPAEGQVGNSPVFIGLDDQGQVTGYAILGEEPGFQDIIRALCGYDPQSDKIIGLEILESKETPGLGDKIFKDADFKKNFDALEVMPEIRVVKKGQRTGANEIEAITGATISSKAVTRLLQKTMTAWREPVRTLADGRSHTEKPSSEPETPANHE